MPGVSLFSPPHAHPVERPRRPLPRRRALPGLSATLAAYARKYGPTNPGLYDLPAPTVAPHRAPRVLYALEDKDPFGEWVNAFEQTDAVRSLRVALETLPHDYDASAVYIRAYRPHRPADALKFWNSPLARAHALNAVLLRGERPMSLVHTELALKHDKLYTQFPNWGVEFVRPHKRSSSAVLQDASGARYDARVVSMDRDLGSALLRLAGLSLTLEGRYDPRGRVFRTSALLALGELDLLPVPVVAAVLGLTESTVLSVLPVACTNERRAPLIEASDLHRAVPEALWRLSIKEAVAAANPCRCVFYDLHAAACGLAHTLPESGTAAFACEDHQ